MPNRFVAATVVAAGLLFGQGAQAEEKLNYFTWAGYELPDFDKAFLEKHPDGVAASIFGDDDDAFTKVKAGFHPDVAHPCYDKI